MEKKTNAKTAEILREWVERDRSGDCGLFSWPTDAAGYDQHIRFVDHRNANWAGGDAEAFRAFVLDYARGLENGS